MKIVRNKLLPPRGFSALYLFGFLFCRRDTKLTDELIRHERIHQAQMMELLVVGFYVLYIAEWLVRLFQRGNAYRRISFEREAYAHMNDTNYLSNRSRFAWRKYLTGT